MKNRKKRIFLFIMAFSMLIAAMPTLTVSASADTGPKPFVSVCFDGLEGEEYYATLLSETDSTGPWSYGVPCYDWQEPEIWEKFSGYEDPDGFYFLGFYEECTETAELNWGYYPPQNFKVLLYFPEYDCLVPIAEALERYAFDTYYTVDASGLKLESDVSGSVKIVQGEIRAEKSYDYTMEIVSLFCRIIFTLLVELGIALLFGFNGKKQLLIILTANIFTQTVLNVLLNLTYHSQGPWAFIFNYVWMEALVFVIEGAIYRRYLHRYSKYPEKKHIRGSTPLLQMGHPSQPEYL